MRIMKKELLSFTVKEPKHRAHKVLFCSNTPFKPKVVQSKKGEYIRKQKHRNKDDY